MDVKTSTSTDQSGRTAVSLVGAGDLTVAIFQKQGGGSCFWVIENPCRAPFLDGELIMEAVLTKKK
jgi:hypothetical protein